MSQVMTSYIWTAGAAASRIVDSVAFTLPSRPMATSVYLSAVEMGTIATFSARLFQLGAEPSVAPSLILAENAGGGTYRATHHNNSTTASATLGSVPARNDPWELVMTLTGAGGVALHQSIRRGPVLSSTSTGVAALASSWSDTQFYLGIRADGSSPGFLGLRAIHIERGVHGMEAMRRLAGTA